MTDHIDTSENLKNELAGARRKDRHQYPRELKSRVIEYAKQRRAAGDGIGRVARELNINPSTFYHWLNELSIAGITCKG